MICQVPRFLIFSLLLGVIFFMATSARITTGFDCTPEIPPLILAQLKDSAAV